MRLYISPSNQPANKYAAGNTNEKQEMEAVALLLQKELAAYNLETIMATLSLHYSQRDEEAKAKGCTLYIALHSDAGRATAIGGTAYSTPETAALAEEIIKEINAICPYPENRADQTKDGIVAGFGEIWGPKAKGIPPILIEVNFHSNPTTAAWIINNKPLIAAAIARALVKTYGLTKKTTAAPAPTKALYRVRKSAQDAASQLGAYSVLKNAISKAQGNPGYSVYNENGEQVYPQATSAPPAQEIPPASGGFKPYLVKINTAFLNFRRGPGVNFPIGGVVKFNEVFTIIGERAGWGELKSGAGWINLKYTKRI